MLNKLRTINMMELFEYFDYEIDDKDEIDDF